MSQTMREALSKLRSAQQCHPNAVQPLIEEAIELLSAPSSEQAQQGAESEDVARFAIKVEKLLCEKLGIPWTVTGISIVSLVDHLASRPAAAAPAVGAMVRDLVEGLAEQQAYPDDWWKARLDAVLAALAGAAQGAEPVGYRVFMDGNQWCAVGPEFVNLQESPAGFADTPYLALERLTEAMAEEKRQTIRAASPQPPTGTEKKE